MQASILPAIKRLQAAFSAAQQVTLNVNTALHEAEAEAARLFNGDFSAAGVQGAGVSAAGVSASGASGSSSGAKGGLLFKSLHLLDLEYRRVAQPAFAAGFGDSDVVAMDDINQGALGNCYLLAGAAAIAKTRPDVIRNAIKDNGNGTYTVTLYPEPAGVLELIQGREKVEITVNNQFVHSKTSGRLEYAQLSNDSETWPMLIEKAYAQYKGGYMKIEGGNPGDFMAVLTGHYSFDSRAKNVDFSELKQNLDRGDAVTASTHDELNKPPAFVYENHAYMIENVDLEKKMVSLYNPWGKDHPTITFDEFKKNYEDIHINKK